MKPPNKGRNSPDISLAEQAYQLIRDRILRGVLPLGAAISRRQLAEEFGMSFLPVSEALQRLEAEELVESRPRVGTRVRIPTAEEVRDRYDLREALESQSARLCADRATFAELLELRRMAAQLDSLFTKSPTGEMDKDFLFAVHMQHFHFHMRLAECGRCEVLRSAIEKNQVLVFNWLYDSAAERTELPANFHSALIEAISTGDPEKADRKMREHIRYGMRSIVDALSPRAENQWRTGRKPAGR